MVVSVPSTKDLKKTIIKNMKFHNLGFYIQFLNWRSFSLHKTRWCKSESVCDCLIYTLSVAKSYFGKVPLKRRQCCVTVDDPQLMAFLMISISLLDDMNLKWGLMSFYSSYVILICIKLIFRGHASVYPPQLNLNL